MDCGGSIPCAVSREHDGPAAGEEAKDFDSPVQVPKLPVFVVADMVPSSGVSEVRTSHGVEVKCSVNQDVWESREDLWLAESMLPAFPKPGQIKKPPTVVYVYADGREVCNTKCREGQEEYVRRKRVMWDRQNKICCLYRICPTCTGRVRWVDSTFEHEAGRGAGGSKRDDRIEVDGKPVNGCAHHWCNAWKGSRPMIYHEEEGA